MKSKDENNQQLEKTLCTRVRVTCQAAGWCDPQGWPCSGDVFFMRLCRSCATLQCQMIENTIISDRAEKDAKRRQVERDTLELKSALKVKGSTAEAVLLHHCLGRKWPKKVGWGGTSKGQTKPFLWGRHKASTICGFEKGKDGEQPVSSGDVGPCLSHQPHGVGDPG